MASPRSFGIELDEFHRGNRLAATAVAPPPCWQTSTHDTKRSEDVRMRLDVLSEIPRLWAAQVPALAAQQSRKETYSSDGRTVPDFQ